MGKLRREARRLTFIIRPVKEVVLPAEQALSIVLINRLPEAVEAVQAGLQRPLPIVGSPWFGLWQGLCGQQTQVPGGGEQPVQIAQQKLFQVPMGNLMAGADRRAIPLVRAAAVEGPSVSSDFAHGPAAVSAPEKAGKGAHIPGEVGRPGLSFQQRLYPCPLLGTDDGLMRTLYHRPLVGRQLLCSAVQGLPGSTALLHIADIHLIVKHPVDGSIGPIGRAPDAAAVAVFLPVQALVLTGAGDTLLIEQLGDRYFSHAVLKEGEDARHHGGGSGVHHQPVVVIRVLAVTVRGEGADELPLPLFGAEGTPHFSGDVPGVLLVKDVFDRQQHVVRALLTVDPVVDGQKAYAVLRKPTLQIATHIDVVPAKPGEVLNHHTVDLPGFNIAQHPPETGTVEIGSRVPVIGIPSGWTQVRPPGQKVLQERALIGDAVALRLVPVLP